MSLPAQTIKFCPTCHYYLFPDVRPAELDDEVQEELRRTCRNCGYSEADTHGGLILETNLQEKVSEGYKVVLNEFTRLDPTLPHVKTIKCPNAECKTNVGGAERDVIPIKYDSVHLKYLYICNVCETQWKSR
jgi:DNA-directed RNA polymerase subunit M/transcription elongation factor TFIIS